MAASDAFSMISDTKNNTLFEEYHERTSAKGNNLNVQLVSALRAQHPELIITTIPKPNCPLIAFASAGYATAELDTQTEPVVSWRGFAPPSHRGGSVSVADFKTFAKYHYKWNNEDFIVYTILVGLDVLQYVLKEPTEDESPLSNSSVTDKLITTIGAWLTKDAPAIYVYDRYWRRSKELWEEVQKASWDKVILDPKMKKSLEEVSKKFFDSKDIYDEYGVPWKRGLIFHGPVGNGKTISVKALMHSLYQRNPPVPTLYVKSAPFTYNIGAVFTMARSMSPCLLVLEDIDTIVTPRTRSYFFNEVDGIASNDGILMVASTNHLEQLDPGLSKRPSRFDRKYLFPLPSKDERVLYCEYWRKKLEKKQSIDFPEKLCPAIADITDDFSFAYLQEAFVATLLDIARSDGSDSDDEDGEDDPLDKYVLWRVMKKQVQILRDEMGDSKPPLAEACDSAGSTAFASAYEETLPMLEQAARRGSAGRLSKTPGQHAASHFFDVDSAASKAGEADLYRPAGMRGYEHGAAIGHGVWEP
ncbi:uncharacterized protein K452DRAFT_227685 [Aplosporella prunicola CBS 121167]|uniref:ATPase AAA-type core domain-containing protein n=1 Tax=Aplosporella prunicola CBS 121167 TaxID=1176127 RepID=A0A6A6BFG8_9PEZI|nr:uncharacterized protein K452DRAFT_227685 [Aplosporella prunicola CBS 121167]KAF2142123.1 hypothetical protein K452DRAFT_227685 [Aplosporella prunicola CBS 121167]